MVVTSQSCPVADVGPDVNDVAELSMVRLPQMPS